MHNPTPPLVFQPIVTDWLIPVILVVVASIGKKLVRLERGWKSEDFYLGPDLCLAAVSVGLVKIFDLLRHLPSIPPAQFISFENEVALSTLLMIFTFSVFIYILSEHRECTGTNPAPFPRIRLAIWCNALGSASLTAFLILIRPFDMLS